MGWRACASSSQGPNGSTYSVPTSYAYLAPASCAASFPASPQRSAWLAGRGRRPAPARPGLPGRRARAWGARRRLARPTRRPHRPAARIPGPGWTPRSPSAPPLTRLRARGAARTSQQALPMPCTHVLQSCWAICKRGMGTSSVLLATLRSAGSSLSHFTGARNKHRAQCHPA